MAASVTYLFKKMSLVRLWDKRLSMPCVISFVLALVLLMVYMCAFYGLIPGLIADGALVLNIFFTMGILASFQAVLTLPGIAGMVLTLGMAVDANVLIYERTKEELRAG